MGVRPIFSLNLKCLREKLGLSQAQLARKADTSESYVGYMERGEKSPTIDMLNRLGAVLRVEPWQFLAPPDLVERGIDKRAFSVLTDYLQCDAHGRDVVASVAEAQRRRDQAPKV